ncbi:MAG: tetratricopeptide repeat protein [Bacteroides sp.]|nr:tetratricopeptide repeat protein [Bacteroidales bacterium]MBD5251329.1 tetratricopeptide repeat protein [Barnesiella sp.]MBD5254315.1 tetratricopeptide repeat protein [Barnesiella sp.]MBD5367984.1 tetratricopeptide repeat protein [Bacteroides sp.]MDE5828993.1 tetratricopeptide repeat protein [Duncaniella sp.]
MKLKHFLSFVLGGIALSAAAQGGYQDGVDYYNADRFEQAKIILDNTINDPATNKAVSYYYLGCIEVQNNNFAAASDNFNKGIEADAAYPMNYIGLGELALRNGNKRGAEDLFKDALKYGKKDARVATAIARAYFNADPVAYDKEISKNVNDALKFSKNKEAATYVLMGDMAKANNIGQAAGYYEQAMVYDEEAGRINPEAYVKYANLYNKVNPDFAINKLIELNQKLPTSALAQRELAEKYYDGGKFTPAAEQYGKYMANPNHFQQDEQRYSGLLFYGKKYPESLEIANKVLAKDPDNVYMQRMVMLNKAALEDYNGAYDAAQKLFAHKGATFTTNDYGTYGDVLAALGRPDDAIVAYTSAFEINPEKNKDYLAKISSMYTDAQNYEKAAEFMQRFVDLGDASLNDYFILSNRYRNLALSQEEGSEERKQSAINGIKYVDLALENAANKGPLYRNRATLLMVRDGAAEISPELVETYNAMLESYNEDPEAKTKYADAYKSAYNAIASYYLQQNDKAKAVEYYQLFLELDPENQGLRDYIEKLSK